MGTEPKWVRPIFGEGSCSICNSKEIHFSRMDSWEETSMTPNGCIKCKNFALKCWCPDCFENCGGKVVGRGSLHGGME